MTQRLAVKISQRSSSTCWRHPSKRSSASAWSSRACGFLSTKKGRHSSSQQKEEKETKQNEATYMHTVPDHQSITRCTSSDTFSSSTSPLTEYLSTREIKSYNRTKEDSEDLAGRRRDREHQKETAGAAGEAIQEAKASRYFFPHIFIRTSARRQECSSSESLAFLSLPGAMSMWRLLLSERKNQRLKIDKQID